MESGRHERVPADRLGGFIEGLKRQARLEELEIEVVTSDRGDGTSDVEWTVSPKATAPAPSATAAVMAGAAAGGAIGAAAAGPVGAAVGAAVGAVAGAAFAKPGIHTLGKLSEKFETGGRGPGTVSTGAGDAGGVSYGLYQMTSRGGGTVARFIGQPDFPHKAAFAGLTPGSAEFTAAWKKLAQDDPAGFGALQHEFIERTHYAPVVDRLVQRTGVDPASRSATLRDVIWSTAVQHGPAAGLVEGCCAALIARGTPKPGDGKAFDLALIEAIYEERGRKDANGTLVHFSRNSQNVQDGVAKRFVNELADARKMLAAEA